jgi:hypothetical protein
LKYMEPTLLKEGEKLFLGVDLINNGDHYISPDVSIEFFDDKGKSIKVMTLPKKGIYPTTSTRFKFDLEGIPGGKTYQAMIVAAGLDNDVFGLEYTLYF